MIRFKLEEVYSQITSTAQSLLTWMLKHERGERQTTSIIQPCMFVRDTFFTKYTRGQ